MTPGAPTARRDTLKHVGQKVQTYWQHGRGGAGVRGPQFPSFQFLSDGATCLGLVRFPNPLATEGLAMPGTV